MTSYICLAASHAPQLFKTITALPLEHHQLSPCTRSSPTAPNMLLFFYHIELPAVAPSPLTTIPFLSTPFSNTPIKGLIFLFLSFLSSHSFEIKLIWLFPAPPHGWAHIRVTSDHIAKHGGPSSDFTASEITITAFSKPSPPSGTASHLDFPLILLFQPISVSSLSSPHLPSFHFVFSVPFILPWQVTWSLRTWDKNFALFCYFTEKFLT